MTFLLGCENYLDSIDIYSLRFFKTINKRGDMKQITLQIKVIILLILFILPCYAIFAPYSIVQASQEERDRAEQLFNEGKKLYNSSDFRGAIEKWETALEIFQKLGQKKTIRNALGNLGKAYIVLGDYRKAIDYHEKALVISEEIGDKEGKGNLLGNLGVSYGHLGDHRKAIGYFEKALAIAKEIGDKEGKGNHLGNLGFAYLWLGDLRKAIDYQEKALVIAEEIGDKEGKRTRLNNLGITYNYLGDYRKAIYYQEKALAIAEEIGNKDGKGKVLGNLGITYGSLGDYRKAINYYEKALVIVEEIGDKYNIGVVLGNMGTVSSQLGDYRKAIDYYEKAIAIEKQIGVPYDTEEGNMGDAFLALGRDKEAFEIYTKQNHSVRLGRYYLKKKDFKEAAKHFERDREKHEKAKDAERVSSERIGLGLSYEGTKEYETAYKWYIKAIDFLENQRDRLSSSEREHFFEGKVFGIPRIEAYEGAVRCAFMLGKYDEAFYWAENTRGRIFSELISGKSSKANYKITASLAKEEEDLTNKIMINKKQQQTAFEKNNPELLKQLEQEYPGLKEKMDRLIDRLRREYPQYAAVKYPQPVKLNQLNLKEGETIIEYEVTEPYTIGLVIKDGKVVKGFKIEKSRTELQNLIAKFRSPFQEGNDPNKFSPMLSKELMELLLKPALSAVQKGEHLVIIPDEALSLVPFEALLMSALDNKIDAKFKPVYAIDEYPITYYQSASVLSLRRGLNISRVKDPTFFGLGDPVFDKEDKRTTFLRGIKLVSKETTDITDSKATKEAGYSFSRIPNTEKEVKEVGKLFGKSKILSGTDASEEKVKVEDLSSRKYVLFSTHGILGNEIPYIKQPALVLSLVGNDKEDGFLTAGEIFGMNLNADLVGLSACKTGLGVQSAGEGVVGLSRAFMYAGADSVLVSLWSVADESTYKLMVKFFEGLKTGKDKRTALKDAKNYLRANGYDNPYYWAPFILMGETN